MVFPMFALATWTEKMGTDFTSGSVIAQTIASEAYSQPVLVAVLVSVSGKHSSTAISAWVNGCPTLEGNFS